MDTFLPISNVINVTITTTPQGISERNVNNLALFTTESPNNADPFSYYISPAQVASDYGSSSITASMANAIFSQSPNVLSGNGRLIIIPLQSAVSATSGDTVTADISANVSSIVGVSDGDLKVTIDTVVYNLTGLDFTRCTTMTDIANTLQASLQNGIVTNDDDTITITSKTVGTDSTVAIAAVSGGTGTNLAGSGYFNSAASTPTAGTNSSGESLNSAIIRTENAVSYCGIITNLLMENSRISTIAATVQARDMIFLHQVCSSYDIAGLGQSISSAGETHTRILFYSNNITDANLMKAAYAGRAFSTVFTGSNTTSTMNLKNLAGITPDNGITQTMYENCKTYGVDAYVNYAGSFGGVLSTGGNDYFDNVYADLALKFALQAAGFNYLAQTNTKVPQTESGMNGLKSAYATIMERFVTNGEFAPGGWNSAETFGNPEIFRNNIATRGYYIYSLPVASQSAVQREDREAPLIQIAAKRAGAIQSSSVLVIINA